MAYIIGMLSVILYAVLDPIAKKLGVEGIKPFQFIAITMTMLAAMSFIAMFVTHEPFVMGEYNAAKIGSLVLYSVINFLGFITLLKSIAIIPIVDMELMRIAAPIFAGLLAFFLLKEPIEPKQLVGLAIMGAGLYVALKPA